MINRLRLGLDITSFRVRGMGREGVHTSLETLVIKLRLHGSDGGIACLFIEEQNPCFTILFVEEKNLKVISMRLGLMDLFKSGPYNWIWVGAYGLYLKVAIIMGLIASTIVFKLLYPNNQRSSSAQTRKEGNRVSSQPFIALNKAPNSKIQSFRRIINGLIPTPVHPPTHIRSRPSIHVLSIKQSINSQTPVPFRPPRRLNQGPYIRFHHHNPRVLVGVFAALSCKNGVLIGVGFAGVKIAVLEEGGGVAEDEVDGAVDVAVAVELAEGVDVESVLVADEAAAVEGGEVGTAAESDGLVFGWAGGVFDGEVAGDEAFAYYGCD
ncbi:hypothetical protein IEQ34_001818 [Dendrobium chrysotoxum]|uniref:Uncharacterized protein n=1 Tax=Dendrobium chrysotoxum TaxID=161865 RepID=A0AAV7HQ34_DENCH|nr:hypothetical protein IEQ34_001818 [Dendrobium chrysotoxum]